MNYPGQHDDRPQIATPLRESVGDRKDIKVSDFDENYARFKIHFKKPSDIKKGKFGKFPSLADSIEEDLDLTIGEEGFKGGKDENFRYTDEDLSAVFGNTKFTLPTDGSFPDRPNPTSAIVDFESADTRDGQVEAVGQPLSSLFRDLPNPDGYKPKIPDIYGMNEENYAKQYLANPFGSDFVRLEVDPDRYSHNKTLGIRHIPLKVNGSPITKQMPAHPRKIPIFQRPAVKTSRRQTKLKRKTPKRKRQLGKKPSSLSSPPSSSLPSTSSIRLPSTMEELRKLLEEERKLKGLPNSKVKLMPFPAPTRNKHRPHSGRLPNIPSFKAPLKTPKENEPLSSTQVKKKLPPPKKRHPMPSILKHKIPQLPMNNLMKDAMVNIPNAIKSLPNFMQKLISSHASFVGSGRSFADGITAADITDYIEDIEEDKEDQKYFSSAEGSTEEKSDY